MGYARGGIAFIGCLLIGVGLGILLDHFWVGGIIGMGVGFVVMAMFRDK